MGFADGDSIIPHEKPTKMPDTLKCGFLGEPDLGGFYQKMNQADKTMAARGAAPAVICGERRPPMSAP